MFHDKFCWRCITCLYFYHFSSRASSEIWQNRAVCFPSLFLLFVGTLSFLPPSLIYVVRPLWRYWGNWLPLSYYFNRGTCITNVTICYLSHNWILTMLFWIILRYCCEMIYNWHEALLFAFDTDRIYLRAYIFMTS